MSPSLSCMSDVLGRPCGGVECKPQKGGMLTVGVNVPKALRFLVKRKTTDEETKETVRLHKKFAAAAAALQDGDAASSSSAPPPQLAPPPSQLQREARALGIQPQDLSLRPDPPTEMPDMIEIVRGGVPSWPLQLCIE